jgi:hypothetical protein
MSKRLLVIDPGASGGIAWEGNNLTDCCNMPEGMTGFVDKIRELQADFFPDEFKAVMEDVGTYMPGNSGPAAVTFARHCGNLEAALYCLGIETIEVPPKKWMATMLLTKFEPLSKTLPDKERATILAQRKAIRKNEIKEYVARRFPHCKVTLKTADALGMLLWAKENTHD